MRPQTTQKHSYLIPTGNVYIVVHCARIDLDFFTYKQYKFSRMFML